MSGLGWECLGWKIGVPLLYGDPKTNSSEYQDEFHADLTRVLKTYGRVPGLFQGNPEW